MKVISCILLLFTLCTLNTAHAEVKTSSLQKQNVEEMLYQEFVGAGVDISNATFNGKTTISTGSQIASFSNNGECDMLEIKNGLVLCTDNTVNVITGNETTLIDEYNVTPEELYELANSYLPKLYQKEIADQLDNYKKYTIFAGHFYKEFSESVYYPKMTEEEYNELMDVLDTDQVFTDVLTYYSYSDAYNSGSYHSYDKYKNTDYEEQFAIYAVYKVVNSWDPKYYTVSEEELNNVKELSSDNFFQIAFRVHYINNAPTTDYDKTKEDLYEQLRIYRFYNNRSNIQKEKELNNLIVGSIFSPAVLEFDFSTTDDTVAFSYSFGSQEYPRYVGSTYNDAFAFIVTDLTTGESKNIAIIPETDLPVTINNVNEKKNSDYFIKNYKCTGYNCEENTCNIDLQGFTTTLMAKTEVEPCRLYHMKIVIANINDYQLQSAVFPEAGSFKSNGISSKTKFSNINARGIVDGCSNGEIVVKVKKKDKPTKVKLSHIGEAKNGIDYKKMPEEIIVPANTDSVILALTPLPIEQDSIEIVIVLEEETSCSKSIGDTVRTYIYNSSPITITPNEAECCANELSVEYTGAIKKISWEPANLLKESDDFVVHPITCPKEDVVFTITAENLFGCQKEEKTITLQPCPMGLQFTTKFEAANNDSVLIADCNDGKLLFNVIRDEKNNEEANISLTYKADATIEGLKKSITIPANASTFELPLKATQEENAYQNDVEVLVKCLNCSIEPTSYTIVIKTEQLEPLALTPANYKNCEVKGLALETALTSGTLGNVTWEPADKLNDIDGLTATLAEDIEDKIDFTVTASDITGCQTATTTVSVVKEDCIDVTAELVTENNSSELIADCNKGKLVFHVTHTKKEGDDVLINLNYDNDAHLAGLTQTYTIPATETVFEIPVEAQASDIAYHSIVNLGIECSNCSTTTDTTLQLTTTQPEKLELAKGTEYTNCVVKGLTLEAKLTSGKLGSVTWEPADKLNDIDGLTATLAEDIEDKIDFTVTASDITGCQTFSTTVSVVKEDCIGVTAEIVTENNSSELVADCNSGQLVFHIAHSKKGGKNADITIKYDAESNLSALPNTFSIPAKDTLFTIPISAQKGDTAYQNVVSLEIACTNCEQSADTTLQLSTTQLEPLIIGQDNLYKSCELEGLEISVPLISGTIGEVVWEPADLLTSTNKLDATLAENKDKTIDFKVTVTDESGCQETTSTVKVVKETCIDIFIPSFFTPDNDGTNDIWSVNGLEQTEHSTIKIYDRWGKLLCEFNANSGGWDGSYNGHPCPSTDYWYVIDIEELDKVYTGHFTLIRK